MDLPQLDGMASVLIGLLLCIVAMFLAYESKGLLIGEGLARGPGRASTSWSRPIPISSARPRLLSMHFGPNDVLLTMEIAFRPRLTAVEAAVAVERLDRAIRGAPSEVRHISWKPSRPLPEKVPTRTRWNCTGRSRCRRRVAAGTQALHPARRQPLFAPANRGVGRKRHRRRALAE